VEHSLQPQIGHQPSLSARDKSPTYPQLFGDRALTTNLSFDNITINMSKARIDLSKLSLNLDGCRFGDGFQNLRQPHQSPSQHSPTRRNDEPESENHNLESHYINNKQIVNQNRHKPEPEILSPLGTTYRSQELSIGNNFLRFRGSTFTAAASSKNDLEILECIGRGGFSSVWKARRISNDSNAKEEYYALKMFCMQSHEKRKMLLRELKLLCTAAGGGPETDDGLSNRGAAAFGTNGGCECLVRLEGAFFDADEGAVTLVSGTCSNQICTTNYNAITQML
jgi:hypothetical protein